MSGGRHLTPSQRTKVGTASINSTGYYEFSSIMSEIRPPEPTSEDRAKAVHTVCAYAQNSTDAAQMLAMLGLDPREDTS